MNNDVASLSVDMFYLQAFANPEDSVALKGKVKLDDPDVERVRR
jgi:hypothetical protein